MPRNDAGQTERTRKPACSATDVPEASELLTTNDDLGLER
jgi:hypothetical protein